MRATGTEHKNNFLVQGSILAIASIISRIIGLIYRVPLTRIIGSVGNNYYACAYEIYNIMLIISSYSIPLAVSKVVAMHTAKKESKNAIRVFHASLIFAFTTGSIAALVIYFFGEYFATKLLATPLSIIALEVLIPTLVIVAVLGVFRGFFQGLGTTVPSAFSQIIEQIINAIVSVWAAYLLFDYGAKIGLILGNKNKYAAAYGAAGGTLGTGVGSLSALIFIFFLYVVFRRTVLRKKIIHDHTRNDASYSSIFALLVMTIVPVLLSTTIYNISSIIDQGVFKNLALSLGSSSDDIDVWWGVFAGEYKVLINVPISIASAMSASCVPSLTKAFHGGDYYESPRQIDASTHFIMLIAFPCAVGLFVLSSPIMQLLFNDSSDLASNMLKVGAVSIVFYSLSTLSNGLLQGINRMRTPVTNAIIALFLHLIFLVILIYTTKLYIFTVIIANAFYALIMCILNSIALRRYSGSETDWFHNFIMPFISSLIMGFCAYGVYRIIYLTTHIMIIAVAASIAIAALVYFLALLFTRSVSRDELLGFPKGEYVVYLAEKMHLM